MLELTFKKRHVLRDELITAQKNRPANQVRRALSAVLSLRSLAGEDTLKAQLVRLEIGHEDRVLSEMSGPRKSPVEDCQKSILPAESGFQKWRSLF